jgi:hypothetical protein
VKIGRVLSILTLIAVSVPLVAQIDSKDSITLLSEHRRMFEIGRKLNDEKLELAKLENEWAARTSMVSAIPDSIQRPDHAYKVGDPPKDQKSARRAKISADAGEVNAKKERMAADRLEKLKRRINSLKRSIAKSERKFAALQPDLEPEPLDN